MSESGRPKYYRMSDSENRKVTGSSQLRKRMVHVLPSRSRPHQIVVNTPCAGGEIMSPPKLGEKREDVVLK